MEMFWEKPLSDLELSIDDIHIWRADLDLTIISIQKLNETLSIDEKGKAERFRFEKDKRRFIAGRGILRTILGCYLNVNPSRVQFCYGKNGKPELADTFGNGTVLFNMSDSDGLALYAFARELEIGVDIERIRDIPEMEQIAERFFSLKENEILRSLPESKKKEAFFNCWTLKEAMIKAIGDGLSYPLDSFDVSTALGGQRELLRTQGESREESKWSVQLLEIGPGLAAAFALWGECRRVHCLQWS